MTTFNRRRRQTLLERARGDMPAIFVMVALLIGIALRALGVLQ